VKTIISLDDDGKLTSVGGVAKAGEFQRRSCSQMGFGRVQPSEKGAPSFAAPLRGRVSEIDEFIARLER